MSSQRFEMKFGAAPRDTAKLLYISKSRFGGDWHSTPHTHGCTELFYCVHGTGKFDIGNVMYNVSPDDLVIVNAHVQHTEISLNTNPLEYIVLGVEGMEFTFTDSGENYAIINCREIRNDVLYLLNLLLKEIGDQNDGFETVCQDLLEVLFIHLLRDSVLGLKSVDTKRAGTEMASVKRYIDEHFSENITLDVLADNSHINKYYLSHAFAQEYGIAPINYLIARRITESKYFLLNTDHSLSKISALLGFSSPSYFAQVFHKAEGVSPSVYRKKLWAEKAAGNP